MNEKPWDRTERRKQEKIDQIHEIIFGNGHPEEGLIWMVRSNTEFISGLKKIFWQVLIFIILGSIGAVGSCLISIYKLVYQND